MFTMAPPPPQVRQWDGHQAQQQYRPAPPMSGPPPPPSAPHDHYRHASMPQHQTQLHLHQPQTQHDQNHHHLQSAPYQPPQPAPLRTDMSGGRPESEYRQQQQGPPPDFRLPPMQAPQYYPGHQMQQYRPMQAPPQVTQSAPRQRTAIACKYCRRRKIRCSGFDNSEDGRCTNCARFSQECIFTPVSAQTQAFVPAQALYNASARDRAPGATPPQLYGSYGQPLPRSDQYSPNSGPPSSNASTYTFPSPSSATSYTSSAAQSQYPPGYPPPHTSYSHPDSASTNRRKRNEEPHTPTVPPPNPGHYASLARRDTDSSTASYGYHEQTSHSNGISPASSTASHPPAHPSYQQAYFQGQLPPPRRPSPPSTYYHAENRGSNGSHGSRGGSSSPNNLLPHYSNGYAPQLTHQSAQHSQASSNASSMRTSTTTTDRTPPTPHTPSVEHVVKPTNPMSIAGLVEGPIRSAADKDMVSALNRPRGL